ncbi:MAG: hypothetical protein M0003_10370 [Acidithiobacillus sp.]|nr:hypothetical protein [Acidithiobacillus sp.]
MWTKPDVFMTIASFGFWIPAGLAWRSHTRATRATLLAEKRHARVAEQVTAPVAAVPATPKGPGLMHKSTVLLFRGIKWTAPRLWAGIRKVSRFTLMVSKAGGKAAVGKYQVYRTNKVAQAKAAATPAVPVSPVVDWDQYEQPAFMRAKNASADEAFQHHQIH